MYEKQQDGDTIYPIPGLVDIHSHILPGLDDGPVNMDQSMEAAHRYAALGFSTIIATPHWITATRWAPTPGMIADKVKEINAELKKKKIALTILPGMEIACSEDLHRQITTGQCQPLNSRGSYLIEFPLVATQTQLSEQVLHNLVTATGKKFIIAHPERCPIFHQNSSMLENLVHLGMHVQVNISSVLGEYGKKAQKHAFRYIQDGLVHFLATDSHARANRKPPGRSQWKKLIKLVGEDMVTIAFGHNPKQMLAGEEVIPLSMGRRVTAKKSFSGTGIVSKIRQRLGR